MKTQKRAGLVGKITGSGANPGDGTSLRSLRNLHPERTRGQPNHAYELGLRRRQTRHRNTAAATPATPYIVILRKKLAAATHPDGLLATLSIVHQVSGLSSKAMKCLAPLVAFSCAGDSAA
jgi:hypothetical protein